MKKSFILIVFVCLLLSSCVAKIDVEESIPIKEELSDISSDAHVTSSQEESVSLASSTALETSEPSDDSNDFKVITEFSRYEFFASSHTGRYTTEFHSAIQSETGITITLLGGRTMELQYQKVTFNEDDQTHQTVINGLDFVVSEYHDSNNNICQVFESDKSIGDSEYSELASPSITVKYYPELERGEIVMLFSYKLSGENLTIHYPDGQSLSKILKYNESEDRYYFE